jgi:putative oligomerization/nucleic acid binding protein
MVVIFGFGAGKGEDQGEVAPTVCPNCHNQVFLHHVRSKKSVRLYFVPVMPYGTDDYLVCPVCSRGLQISGPQVPEVRSMTQATASLRAGQLSEAAYGGRVDQFWRRLGGNPARQPPPAPGGPRAPVSDPPPGPAPSATAAAPGPATGDTTPTWLSQLRELAQLHDQGVLSDEQYEAAKRRAIQQE